MKNKINIHLKIMINMKKYRRNENNSRSNSGGGDCSGIPQIIIQEDSVDSDFIHHHTCDTNVAINQDNIGTTMLSSMLMALVMKRKMLC